MQNVEMSPEVAVRANARSKAPVFVVGCPRSGTTLLYHMLLSAGNFAVYRAESQVFNLLEPRFGSLKRAANRRKLLAAWQETELFRRTGLAGYDVSDEVMSHCQNGGDFLRIFMEAMVRCQGVQRWADCTPEHLLYLDRIKQTIPDAMIIHIIRDGRDVALSLEKQAWIRPFAWDRGKTLEVAALYWEWIVRKGRENGRTLGKDYIEVRFEDLVLDPRKVLESLSGFVEQELDYDKIQRAGIGSVSQPNSSFPAGMTQGEFTPIGRWKTALTAAQLERLETLLGRTLRELGYSTGGEASFSGSSRGMRLLYRIYFDVKLQLKKAPFGKLLASAELPRF
jgi:hypothetical protein